MTEDGFKSRFRSCRPESGETFIQFANRQSSYLLRWVEMAGADKTYDMLFDLMVKDQFLHVCSKDLKLFLKEHTPRSVKEMAAIADQYKEARNSSASSLATPTQSSKNTANAVVQGSQGKTDFNQRPRSERRCFICNMTNHIARDCRRRADIQRNNTGGSPAADRSFSLRPDFRGRSRSNSSSRRVSF